MNSDIAIKVENLSKVFPLRQAQLGDDGQSIHENWALKDVSFEVRKGESVGIIGPNGSGKSTLLKILAGITKPTSGKVSLRGKVASILDIGAGFHPELSGRENVFLNGQLLGFSKKVIQSKFDEIVAFSEIQKFIDEPVKNYSNGMYLRLAFSIMIHLDFDVYLLDEVMGVGDDQFKTKVQSVFEKKMAEKSCAILLVSHNFQEIEHFTMRSMLFQQGRIKSQGEMHDLVYELKQSYFLDKAEQSKNSKFSFADIELRFEVAGKPTKLVSIEDDIEVFISMENSDLNAVKIALRVRDILGNVVFVTSYSDLVIPALEEFKKVSIHTIIPKFYFNKGHFSFDIIGYQDQSIAFTFMNVAALEVHLGNYKNDYWLNNTFGPVRPFLNWEIKGL